MGKIPVYRVKRSGEVVKPKPHPNETPSISLNQHQTHPSKIKKPVIDPSKYINHEVLAKVFKKYVTKSGWVNYRRLKRDKRAVAQLKAYVEDLSALDPSSLEDTADRISSWLNLYNAMVILELLKHYPIKSLMQIKDYYGSPRFEIAGEKWSLLKIDSEIFKKMAEPRTIFARVNGASSGPRLRREPYHALKLNEQLNAATWDFLLKPQNVSFEPKKRILTLNPLFLWYQKDFVDFPAFLRTYLDKLPPYFTLSYRGFNWTLNDEKLH